MQFHHDPPETADGTAKEFVGADEDGKRVSSDDPNELVASLAVPAVVSSPADPVVPVVRAAAPTKTAVAATETATSACVARRTRRWLSSRLLPIGKPPFGRLPHDINGRCDPAQGRL
jgi:hypothetical protein